MQQVSQCEDKLKMLLETSKFLCDVLQEPLMSEMKEQALVLRQRMEEVRQAVMLWRQEASQQGRQSYRDTVSRIKTWLDRVDFVLRPLTVECRLADVEQHVRDVEVCSIQSCFI